ncbi:hypothetical protein HDV05_002470 [Chytridiales sp. JEL 0842]|nr:hypothetical protein HDV05_002470 [Chytridiales sp. JEL 0842]
MKYIVEHMEEGLSEWVTLEYTHMIAHLKSTSENQRLILSSLQPQTLESLPKVIADGAYCTTKSVLEIAPVSEILLLDPAAPQPLTPQDSASGKYKYLLFGGILGDDPPRDRTKELRVLGFETRHLDKYQMTTDTAVLVSKIVLEENKQLHEIPYVDRPEIQLYKNESVEMPFRYVTDKDGKPIVPSGFVDLLKKSNDMSFDF